jgi:hypothetical protein
LTRIGDPSLEQDGTGRFIEDGAGMMAVAMAEAHQQPIVRSRKRRIFDPSLRQFGCSGRLNS